MKFLRTLFKKVNTPEVIEPFTANFSPEIPLFIIGDIHGCGTLLEKLLQKQPDGTQLVFVGDLIDRGDQSSEVLNIVKACCDAGAVCLMGNHEKMLLDFLDDPAKSGPRWLKYGGLQTMQSYGVRGIHERSNGVELLTARANLRAAMPEGMEEWLRALPLHWSSGNVHVVHAAADPEVDMGAQPSRVLLWGTSRFSQRPRTDGQWVVYGHTIVDEAQAEDGRFAVDTGAYLTGMLTGAYIKDNAFEIIMA